MAKRHAGGSRNSAMTRHVIQVYGAQCYLRLPGCTHVATTRDHVIPLAHGGPDTVENCRPACRSCNSLRQDRAVNGIGANIMIVTGPPAAGKSTWVLDHAQPNDVVIDLDRLVDAVSPRVQLRTAETPAHVKNLAVKARRALITAATRMYTKCNVWLIHALPTQANLAEYTGFGWPVIMIDPGRATVEARAATMRRPAMRQVIAQWYDLHAQLVAPIAARHVTEWDRDHPADLVGLRAPATSSPDTPATASPTSSSRPW